MKRIKRTYRDFWAERILNRWKPIIAETDDLMKIYRAEADFLREVLSLSPGQKVLDIGCGAGEHCLALAEHGINATGIDIAPSLVDHACQQAEKAGVPAEFLCADMRTFRPETRFDAVFTASGTFGMFNDADNRAVLETIACALTDDGKFLLGPSNPSVLEQESFTRKSWFFVEDGCFLREFGWDRSTSHFFENYFFIDSTGTLVESGGFDDDGEGLSARTYSFDQLTEMIETAGFTIEATYGSFELPPKPYAPNTPRLLILGSRRDP